MALKLVICCSNSLFAEGLKSLIEDEKEIRVVGVFTGQNLFNELNEARELHPDVILLDSPNELNILMSLPDDFFALNHLKILIIGDRSVRNITNKTLKNLILKGVVGILPPSADSDLLRKALKAIFSGELWLDRATLMKLFTGMKQAADNVRLAQREKEVIAHICQGYRNKEIAQKLGISEQTVKSHCYRIYKKIGVSDRLQLALHYFKI